MLNVINVVKYLKLVMKKVTLSQILSILFVSFHLVIFRVKQIMVKFLGWFILFIFKFSSCINCLFDVNGGKKESVLNTVYWEFRMGLIFAEFTTLNSPKIDTEK